MGTDEECMAWVRDEIGRVVALPREIGGIPLDEIGATGWGLSHVVDVALQYCDFELEGARLVIQGFGAVGHLIDEQYRVMHPGTLRLVHGDICLSLQAIEPFGFAGELRDQIAVANRQLR